MSERLSLTRTIEQSRIDAYAEASGDRNPLHIDPVFAAGTPFGGTVAHGMLVLALISEMMHAAHGATWRENARLKVRFKAPTRPGETVTASARETKRSAGTVEYEVRCENQAGETLIDGRATVGGGG